MRHATWRTRVRQLADPAWLGRTVDGYANLIAARLRKLAGEGSTGMLPMSGHGESAIFFRDGKIVYAESGRTPVPRAADLAALGLTHGETRVSADQVRVGTAEVACAPSASRLASMIALAEPTIDAATELLSSDYRYAKFRPGGAPPAGHARPILVDTLLAEVQRRRGVLRQLAAIVTPDTTIVRQPSLGSPSVQVSRGQWAVLVRVGEGTTPRGLAMGLSQSVFGTTIEVYRLVALGLLTVPGHQPASAGGPDTRPAGVTMSFMRAASGESGQ